MSRLHMVKSLVADGLALRVGLDGVQISSGELGSDEYDGNERIVLIGEDAIEQEWAGIGRLSRDEQLTLTGSIYVSKPGIGEETLRAVRGRAFELMREVELFFVDSPTAPAIGWVDADGVGHLGAPTGDDASVGPVVKAARARPFAGHDIATPDGRVYLLGFEIITELTRLTAI